MRLRVVLGVFISKVLAAPCEDTEGYKDLMGHGCDVYAHPGSRGERICFGGEPRMPLDFYMLFADPTMGNALDSCCACGKPKDFGQRAWKQPIYHAPAKSCTDVQHWKDAQGSGCDAYSFQCSDGDATVPHAMITQYADEQGVSALDACCACGRKAKAVCQDHAWEGPDGEQCFFYAEKCADGKPVADAAFPANARGVTAKDACCHCGGGSSASCTDYTSWQDAQGKSCAGYGEEWCRQGYAVREAAAFAEHAVAGTSALDACCACGGGSGGNSYAHRCVDASWTDANGATCDSYGAKCRAEAASATTTLGGAAEACCACMGGCTDQGGWVDNAGDGCGAYSDCASRITVEEEKAAVMRKADAHGVSALSACCACQGGCRNLEGWRDSGGYGCGAYADVCEGGGPRPGAKLDFAKFARDGVSALDACCECGRKRSTETKSTAASALK